MTYSSESIDCLDKLKRWMDVCCCMGASSDSDNDTPLACESKHATTSSLASFSCVRSKNLIIERKVESEKGTTAEDEIEQSEVHWSQLSEHTNDDKEVVESEKSTTVEDEIERSKVHWSELIEHINDGKEVAEVSNVEVFQSLQKHPTWGHFFHTFGDGGEHDYGELVVGEKFAEGGQAKLYHARVNWKNPEYNFEAQKRGIMFALKVFRKGTFLRDLQKQWPEGIFKNYEDMMEREKLGKCQQIKFTCDIDCGTLLSNGRFAFLLVKETEDLRTLIDRNMKARTRPDSGPFPMQRAFKIMYLVARGMDWLHNLDIVHRDLKASNVLCAYFNTNSDKKTHAFYVVDFECSIGVVGTGFFRTPEILQAIRDRVVNERPNLFTKASDVYSYRMVCYEILTGKLPFEGHPTYDFDVVLNGQHLDVPHYVDKWVHGLLQRCWQFDSTMRPTLEEILRILEANSELCKGMKHEIERRETLPMEEQMNSIYEFGS